MDNRFNFYSKVESIDNIKKALDRITLYDFSGRLFKLN